MEVKNIRWVGILTRQYDEMVRFLGDVMGMRRNFEEPATAEFKTTEGDEVQVMGPDDLGQARQRLVEARTEIVGPPGRDSHWEWLHFRAPDGHLYELATGLPS